MSNHSAIVCECKANQIEGTVLNLTRFRTVPNRSSEPESVPRHDFSCGPQPGGPRISVFTNAERAQFSSGNSAFQTVLNNSDCEIFNAFAILFTIASVMFFCRALPCPVYGLAESQSQQPSPTAGALPRYVTVIRDGHHGLPFAMVICFFCALGRFSRERKAVLHCKGAAADQARVDTAGQHKHVRHRSETYPMTVKPW